MNHLSRFVVPLVLVTLLFSCKASKLYKEAVKVQDIAHYERFVAQYPKNKHVPEVNAKLFELYEERDWTIATKQGTAIAMRQFIVKGVYILEASNQNLKIGPQLPLSLECPPFHSHL